MFWSRRREAWVQLGAFAAIVVLSLSLHRLGGERTSRTSISSSAESARYVSAPPVALRKVASDRGRDGDQFSKPGAGRGSGLVLIKSFKTGSTTLATYIAQVGHQRGSYFLHPKATGWFARGELESRRDEGQRFDVSLRHVTPNTPYGVLEELVPGAAFVTIMRRPVERFLSLFNMRADLKRRFKTPQAVVAAIHAGKLPRSDARPFCNQLAWLMSGRDADYTGIFDEAEVNRVAGEVIAEAEKRGVMVLITERMSESFAVLANRMQWDMEELKVVAESQRVQKGRRDYFTCPGNEGDVSNLCFSAIRGCNQVDEVLYRHYDRKFEELVLALPPSKSPQTGTIFDESPEGKAKSALALGKFPINCISNDSPPEKAWNGMQRTRHDGQVSNEELYRHHSCDGRPAWLSTR
ncbi:unnamed protein product [Pylaiella littoralis]